MVAYTRFLDTLNHILVPVVHSEVEDKTLAGALGFDHRHTHPGCNTMDIAPGTIVGEPRFQQKDVRTEVADSKTSSKSRSSRSIVQVREDFATVNGKRRRFRGVM